MADRINDIRHTCKEGALYRRIASAIAGHCSGSGFDCDWYFTDKGKYINAFTERHLMDSGGYYCGYYGFTVIIPKKNPRRVPLAW